VTARGVVVKLGLALATLALLAGLAGAVVLAHSARFRTWLWLPGERQAYTANAPIAPAPVALDDLTRLALAAEELGARPTRYVPDYVTLAYPGGDVPADTGVCTDLIVRAFRTIGLDLQAAVAEDMRADFAAYPKLWGLSKADPNIDHRRVPNLMVWFQRHGEVLPITDQGADYHPGDVVVWDQGAGQTHIGLVTTRRTEDTDRPLIAHHNGGHPRIEDVLFAWPIVGHYRIVSLPRQHQRAPVAHDQVHSLPRASRTSTAWAT
jgi:uncharacterized protein